MKISKLYIALGAIIAFALFFEFVAHADEINESTKVTFSAPVQIPGQVLPAGTYIFQQADPNSDPNLIQVLNADRSVTYAILQTVSAERMEPVGDTSITLAEPGSGNPDLLVKWFYPGSVIGHEFIYSKQQEQKIAQAKQKAFVGNQVMPSAENVGE
jgi:hypothetical protein